MDQLRSMQIAMRSPYFIAVTSPTPKPERSAVETVIVSPLVRLSVTMRSAYSCNAVCDGVFCTCTVWVIFLPRREMERGDCGFVFSPMATIPSALSAFEQMQTKAVGLFYRLVCLLILVIMRLSIFVSSSMWSMFCAEGLDAGSSIAAPSPLNQRGL